MRNLILINNFKDKFKLRIHERYGTYFNKDETATKEMKKLVDFV